MAMNNDFTRNKLGFDTNGFMVEFEKVLNISLDRLSYQIVDLFKEQIWENSLASKAMKADAIRAVREISRKIENGIVELEIGVDEDYAHGMGTQFFVRTMASIYGNLTLGNGKLTTKPGQMTWRKDVTDYHLNTFSKKVKRLKSFEQKDKSKKIVKEVLSNISKQSNKYIGDFLQTLDMFLNGEFFSRFITVG